MPNQNERKNRKAFLTLLEKLQQDSWQLELLISGFVIFLLLGAWEPLRELQIDTNYLSYSIQRSYTLEVPVTILFLGWIFLLFNLFLHVLLRGLWISTLGLRYVSGDIDYNSLGYSTRFAAYLRKRIGTFDRYIERLENLCSVIFAFTFLIIFVFISMGLFILFIGLTANGMSIIKDYLVNDGDNGLRWFAIPPFIFLLFGLIYFIDFLTLGFFKKKRWMYKWYIPIYKFMSVITLSFLYRPMYYNLIDNKFGRWIGFLLVPYILLILVITSFNFETHPFFPEDGSDKLLFYKDYYDNLIEEGHLILDPTIPDPYVKNDYLELFIPYLPTRVDSVIARICPGFEPMKRTRLKTGIVIVNNDDLSDEQIEAKADSSFNCLTQAYQIIINDSTYQNLSFYLYEHSNNNVRGLKSVIDIQQLPRGEHHLKVQRRRYKRRKEMPDSLYWRDWAFIPFWKE